MNKFAFEKICQDLGRSLTKNIIGEYKKNKKINYINNSVVDALMNSKEETIVTLCKDGYIDGNFVIENLVASGNLLNFIFMLYDNAIQFDGDLIIDNTLMQCNKIYYVSIFNFLYEKKLIHNYEFIYKSVPPPIEILKIVDNVIMIDYNRIFRSSFRNIIPRYHVEYNYILDKISDVSDINVNDIINIYDFDSSLINILIEKGLNINIIKSRSYYRGIYCLINDINDDYIGYIDEIHISTSEYVSILLKVGVNKLDLLLSSVKIIINDSLSYVMPCDRKYLFEKYNIDTNDIIMSMLKR
jgi:hypothetical protein